MYELSICYQNVIITNNEIDDDDSQKLQSRSKSNRRKGDIYEVLATSIIAGEEKVHS